MKYTKISSIVMFVISGILVLLAIKTFMSPHTDQSGSYTNLMLAAVLFAINPIFHKKQKP